MSARSIQPVDPLVQFWKENEDEYLKMKPFPSAGEKGEMENRLKEGLSRLFVGLDSEKTALVIQDFLKVFGVVWERLEENTREVGENWRLKNYNLWVMVKLPPHLAQLEKMDFQTLATVVENFTEFSPTLDMLSIAVVKFV